MTKKFRMKRSKSPKKLGGFLTFDKTLAKKLEKTMKKFRWMDGFALSPKKNPGDLPYVPAKDGERRRSDRRKRQLLDSVERMKI